MLLLSLLEEGRLKQQARFDKHCNVKSRAGCVEETPAMSHSCRLWLHAPGSTRWNLPQHSGRGSPECFDVTIVVERVQDASATESQPAADGSKGQSGTGTDDDVAAGGAVASDSPAARFRFTICNAGPGVEFHPSKPSFAPPKIKYLTSATVTDVAGDRFVFIVLDGTRMGSRTLSRTTFCVHACVCVCVCVCLTHTHTLSLCLSVCLSVSLSLSLSVSLCLSLGCARRRSGWCCCCRM